MLKKESKPLAFLFILLILLIISTPLILAQNTTQNSSETSELEKKEIKNPFEKSNELLIKESELAQKEFIKTIFNIKPDEKITQEKIIVMICIFIAFLIILKNILIIVPFFEGKKSWLGAIIITFLASLGGAINIFTDFLFNLFNIFIRKRHCSGR